MSLSIFLVELVPFTVVLVSFLATIGVMLVLLLETVDFWDGPQGAAVPTRSVETVAAAAGGDTRRQAAAMAAAARRNVRKHVFKSWADALTHSWWAMLTALNSDTPIDPPPDGAPPVVAKAGQGTARSKSQHELARRGK